MVFNGNNRKGKANIKSTKKKGPPEERPLFKRDSRYKTGTPGGSRTPNLLVRSQALYPIELRVHFKNICYYDAIFRQAKSLFQMIKPS